MVSVLRQLARWSLRLVLCALLLMTLLLLGVRVSFSLLPLFHERIVIYLNDQLDTSFDVDVLTSRWEGITPFLTVRGLRLQGHEADRAAFRVGRLDLELNVTASILNLSPVIANLEVNDVDLLFTSDASDNWSLYGIKGSHTSSSPQKFDLQKNLEWLSKQEYIDVTNARLELLPYERRPVVFHTRYLSLNEQNGLKQLLWGVDLGGGQIRVKAVGQGTRRWNTDWSGQVVVTDVDIVPVCELVSDCARFLAGARVNADGEWRFQTGNWQFDTEMAVTDVHYLTPDGQSLPASLSSSMKLFGYSQGWQITDWNAELGNTQIMSGAAKLTLPEIKGHGNYQGEAVIDISLDQLHLANARSLADSFGVMPDGLQSVVNVLNPVGQLKDIEIRYYPHRDPLADGSIVTRARLEQVSVDAWGGAPSSGNVNGWLYMDTLSGYFDLETRDFQLGLPEIFSDTWTFYSAKARLEWDVIDDIYRLKSDDIVLHGDAGWLNGKLVLNVPFGSRSGQPLYLDVDVGIEEGIARHAKKFIPAGVLEESLNDWLNASIIDAQIHKGRFSIAGSLDDDPDSKLLWSLMLDVENGVFEYGPDWPMLTDLKASVFVNNDEVLVEVEQAKTYDTLLSNAKATLKLDDDLTVKVQSQLQAQGKDVVRILRETPLDKVLGGEAANWAVTGDLVGDLRLTVPVEQVEETYARVSATTDNASFQLATPDILLTDLHGDIVFDTDTGLSSAGIGGNFLGDPFEAAIASSVEKGAWQNLRFDWSGHAAVNSLHRWLDLDILSLMEGSADYHGELTIPFSGGKLAQLQVKSSLRGIAIELPAPVGISAEEENPLSLRLDAYSDRNDLLIKLENVGTTEILFDQDFEMQSAGVALGEQAVLPEQERGRIRLAGSVSGLELDPWVELFSGQPPAEEEVNLLARIEIDNVSIRHLGYGKYQWQDLVVNLVPGPHYTEVTVNSESVDGQLLIPNRPSLPYSLEMTRLHLPDLFAGEDDDKEDDDPLKAFNPADLPSAIVKIDSLKMGGQDYGHLSFIMQPLHDGKRISDIKASMDGMNYEGSLDWLYRNEHHETQYQGHLRGDKIDAFQDAMGLTPMVAAKDSRIDTSLNWQGSPLGTNMHSLDGTVKLRLRDGSLKNLEGGAGALKLFGLFNIDALLRRMRLDFSDLYASGISFDSLRGELHFDKGIITFDEALTVDGPSSDFKLDGLVNTNDEVLDLSLVVSLPVSANLPILSVLLGTAPQVAGIFYIADKLVGNRVDQLASIRYRINGSFDDPDVSLDQLFSSKTKRPDGKK